MTSPWPATGAARPTAHGRPSSTRPRSASSRRRPRTAIDLLEADHRRVEELFTRFERAGRRGLATKGALVDAMIDELSVHTTIEQALLYPLARDAVPDAESDVLEALEEHHVLAWQLQELDGLDPGHERFDARVTVLMEHVRQHQRDEEDLLFPELRTHLGRDRLVELGAELAALRPTVPAGPQSRRRRAPVDYRLTDVVAMAVGAARRLARTGRR